MQRVGALGPVDIHPAAITAAAAGTVARKPGSVPSQRVATARNSPILAKRFPVRRRHPYIPPPCPRASFRFPREGTNTSAPRPPGSPTDAPEDRASAGASDAVLAAPFLPPPSGGPASRRRPRTGAPGRDPPTAPWKYGRSRLPAPGAGGARTRRSISRSARKGRAGGHPSAPSGGWLRRRGDRPPP